MTAGIQEHDNMFYYGQRPWHGMGVEVPDAATSDEALVAAGLDWEVETRELFTEHYGEERMNVMVGNYAIVRKDTEEALGVCGSRYHCIQNRDAFELLDGIVGEKLAMYHTAGSLWNGRKVWMQAKLPEVMRVAGNDILEQYLLLSTSHDGSGACSGMFTPERVVCQNTLNIAMGRATNTFRIRHTTKYKDKMEQAREALGLAHLYFNRFQERADWMARQKFTDIQMQMLAQGLFPAKDENEVPTRTQNNRNKVVRLFDQGIGLADFRGTAWAAINAVAEYTDHHRQSRGDEARLNSVWWGGAAQMKTEAMNRIDTLLKAA